MGLCCSCQPEQYSEEGEDDGVASASGSELSGGELEIQLLGGELILEAITSGALAPLRGSWLIDLHANGGVLARRQDLPPEAFFSADDCSKMVRALGDSYGLLFVALSSRWLSAQHPDPDGHHLAIVAEVAELYTHNDPRRSPLAAAFKARGLGQPDFALFWDFGSLHQSPRSDEEELLFLVGLRAAGHWYAHEQTVVWMQTELPDGFSSHTYDASGWCHTESAMSSVVKLATRRLDLAKRTEDCIVGGAYGGNKLAPAYTLDRVCSAHRLPPMLPDDMRRLLEEEKKFREIDDIATVDSLYRSIFERLTSTAPRLRFRQYEWGEKEAARLAVTLPYFGALTALDLSRNPLGDAGVEALAAALGLSASLTELSLARCGLGRRAAQALMEALPVSTSLTEATLLHNGFDAKVATALAAVSRETQISLCGITPHQTEASFKAQRLKPADGILIAAALCFREALASCDVRNNTFSGDAARQLAAAVLGNTTLENFNEMPLRSMREDKYEMLSLKSRGIGVEGGLVLAGLLPRMPSLTECDLRANGVGAEGWTAIFETLRDSTANRIHTWSLSGQVGIKECQSLSEYMAASESLTDLDLSDNFIGEGCTYIAAGIGGSSSLTQINLANNAIGPAGARALIGAISGSRSLIQMDLSHNDMGEAAEQALRDAVKGREGFLLEMLPH